MALNQENAKNAPFRRNRPRKRGSCKQYNEAAVEPEVMSSLPGQGLVQVVRLPTPKQFPFFLMEEPDPETEDLLAVHRALDDGEAEVQRDRHRAHHGHDD